MRENLEDIVDGIAEVADTTALWELVDRRMAAGDSAFVAELGVRLWRRYSSGGLSAPWQYRSLFDRILRVLTLSAGAVGDAVRLLWAVQGGRPVRFGAALLASGHPVGELRAALATTSPPELRACLLHELVLRGAAVDVEWGGEPWWGGHPLAWLPVSLTPLEGRPEVNRYSLGGGGGGRPAERTVAIGGVGEAAAAEETTTEQLAAVIGGAVQNWANESNGHIFSRVYSLSSALRPGAVLATLRGLELECLRGLDGVGAGTAENVWAQLFVAASSGGAYNAGEFGAYGRLAAWRSVAALAGAPPAASAAEVEEAVRACAWYGFAGASEWFQRVAWDIGIAAVTADGRRLALLAATDTD
ncbi:DUF6183 family protein [Dactylosporangium sp. NPDC051541]|uniref:DUF6183 family protein n=1 Tax=Dactylosporangium sp. NPDC051541 TaxID=3363977 RepID=UPI0037B3A17A